MGILPWFCLRDGEEGDEKAAVAADLETGAEEVQRLYCGDCGAVITDLRHGFPVDGSFEHTFINPGGYAFRIGCFREAPGCFHAGEPTAEHSWFKGTRWHYAVCASCVAHLGWYYLSGGERGFYGLILDRLSPRRGA